MTTVKIQEMIKELQDEATELIKERQTLAARDREIEMRIQQIQGSLNALIEVKKQLNPETPETDS